MWLEPIELPQHYFSFQRQLWQKIIKVVKQIEAVFDGYDTHQSDWAAGGQRIGRICLSKSVRVLVFEFTNCEEGYLLHYVGIIQYIQGLDTRDGRRINYLLFLKQSIQFLYNQTQEFLGCSDYFGIMVSLKNTEIF